MRTNIQEIHAQTASVVSLLPLQLHSGSLPIPQTKYLLNKNRSCHPVAFCITDYRILSQAPIFNIYHYHSFHHLGVRSGLPIRGRQPHQRVPSPPIFFSVDVLYRPLKF